MTQTLNKLEITVELQQDKDTLRNWMSYCLKREDWHGVMDAAADIREIEAKLEILNETELTQKSLKSYCDDCNCGKVESCGN